MTTGKKAGKLLDFKMIKIHLLLIVVRRQLRNFSNIRSLNSLAGKFADFHFINSINQNARGPNLRYALRIQLIGPY